MSKIEKKPFSTLNDLEHDGQKAASSKVSLQTPSSTPSSRGLLHRGSVLSNSSDEDDDNHHIVGTEVAPGKDEPENFSEICEQTSVVMGIARISGSSPSPRRKTAPLQAEDSIYLTKKHRRSSQMTRDDFDSLSNNEPEPQISDESRHIQFIHLAQDDFGNLQNNEQEPQNRNETGRVQFIKPTKMSGKEDSVIGDSLSFTGSSQNSGQDSIMATTDLRAADSIMLTKKRAQFIHTAQDDIDSLKSNEPEPQNRDETRHNQFIHLAQDDFGNLQNNEQELQNRVETRSVQFVKPTKMSGRENAVKGDSLSITGSPQLSGQDSTMATSDLRAADSIMLTKKRAQFIHPAQDDIDSLKNNEPEPQNRDETRHNQFIHLAEDDFGNLQNNDQEPQNRDETGRVQFVKPNKRSGREDAVKGDSLSITCRPQLSGQDSTMFTSDLRAADSIMLTKKRGQKTDLEAVHPDLKDRPVIFQKPQATGSDPQADTEKIPCIHCHEQRPGESSTPADKNLAEPQLKYKRKTTKKSVFNRLYDRRSIPPAQYTLEKLKRRVDEGKDDQHQAYPLTPPKARDIYRQVQKDRSYLTHIPYTPTDSKLLRKVRDDINFNMHRYKIGQAKPCIDNKPPLAPLNMYTRQTNVTQSESELAKTKYQNRILIKKLRDIYKEMYPIQDIANSQQQMKKSQQGNMLQRDLKISDENMALLRRILETPSHYTLEDNEKWWSEMKRRIRRISSDPLGSQWIPESWMYSTTLLEVLKHYAPPSDTDTSPGQEAGTSRSHAHTTTDRCLQTATMYTQNKASQTSISKKHKPPKYKITGEAGGRKIEVIWTEEEHKSVASEEESATATTDCEKEVKVEEIFSNILPAPPKALCNDNEFVKFNQNTGKEEQSEIAEDTSNASEEEIPEELPYHVEDNDGQRWQDAQELQLHGGQGESKNEKSKDEVANTSSACLSINNILLMRNTNPVVPGPGVSYGPGHESQCTGRMLHDREREEHKVGLGSLVSQTPTQKRGKHRAPVKERKKPGKSDAGFNRKVGKLPSLPHRGGMVEKPVGERHDNTSGRRGVMGDASKQRTHHRSGVAVTSGKAQDSPPMVTEKTAKTPDTIPLRPPSQTRSTRGRRSVTSEDSRQSVNKSHYVTKHKPVSPKKKQSDGTRSQQQHTRHESHTITEQTIVDDLMNYFLHRGTPVKLPQP